MKTPTLEDMIEECVRKVLTEKLDPFLKTLGDKKGEPSIPSYLTPKQLSKILPYSEGHLRNLYHMGVLPGYKPEGRLFFRLEEVQSEFKKWSKRKVFNGKAVLNNAEIVHEASGNDIIGPAQT